jgi:hypothetical protein
MDHSIIPQLRAGCYNLHHEVGAPWFYTGNRRGRKRLGKIRRTACASRLGGRGGGAKGTRMDSTTAAQLAAKLGAQQQAICQQVAARMLHTYPELEQSLRLEEQYEAAARLSAVAVERLGELVRTVLLFELPTLADGELAWAHGILPQRGVTHQHQSTMVRWYFEELRRLPLSPAEQSLAREIEQHFLQVVHQVYEAS